MNVRFYVDNETGLPHIYNHGVSESEVEAVLSRPIEERSGYNDARIALGQTDGGIAYELTGKALAALLNRRRKKS